MSNIYLIVGSDAYLVNEAKLNIIKERQIEQFNISSYNFTDSEPLEILNEMTTVSLLGEERMVVISQPEFLKCGYKNTAILDKFINYFSNPSQETIVVIIVENELDYKLKINALLKEKAKIIRINSFDGENLKSWINTEVEKDGYKIDFNAVEELILRTDGDIMLIKNELEKLKLYHEDKNISYSSVKLMVSRNLEDNIFDLLNAFVANDKKLLFQIYEDFITLNEDEMRIISAISNKIEEILYTKTLINERKSKDEIADYFKVKPGRAYYMMQAAKKISDNSLMNIMQRISELDFNIKSGKIDKKLGLQLFILGV